MHRSNYPTAVDIKLSPNLKTVLFTGDEKQLLNYTEDVPETVLDFGFKSLLIHAIELQSPVVKTIRLVSTYRFHPEITRCLGKAIYGPSLIPNTAATERRFLTGATGLPLPNRESPILLFHMDDGV